MLKSFKGLLTKVEQGIESLDQTLVKPLQEKVEKVGEKVVEVGKKTVSQTQLEKSKRILATLKE